ncbi:isocitrate lyase/PEP mutase family protein [Halorientalis salina]|uniref:isocitrate lyase/PEP mutase family protein n=1 Tax=Halorientalis salina TaxID=2932266 RepID=UPI0010ABA5B7|nr:isocitrate lyase/PEP mutase family protein [Halorientalis salina]
MNDQTPPERLRSLLSGSETLALPGVFDALSARLAEQAGFDAVFTSGFGIAATTLGMPDMGLLTMAENTDRVDAITDSVDVPLVADMDTGYGSALNVRRTMGECVDAGVAGVILEDQAWPKKCGHMDEKRVVDTEEHVRRVQAAADVRAERDSEFVIVGRTDARERHGLDEAIERGHAYVDAGADVVFVEAPESRAELERIGDAFDVPTFANMVEGGKTPFLPADELEAMGFDIVVYPLSALFAATAAMQEAYETLATEGTTAGVDGVGFEGFEAVVDAPGVREQEARYGAADSDE